MLSSMRWFIPVGLLTLGSLVAVEPAAAQPKTTKPVPLNGVKDRAGMFSEQAVTRARDEIASIKRATKKDLVIGTFVHPDDKYKGKKVEQYAETWALENYKDHLVDGVYVLICKEPKILRVALGNATRDRGLFTADNRQGLRDLMLEKFKEADQILEAKGPDAEKKAQALHDEALLEGVAYVRKHMVAAGGNVAAGPTNPRENKPWAAAPQRESFWSTPLGWVVIGLGILLVLWLIIGIFRALAGAGRGAPGYGGGGGGGFMSGLLGGLFGAMAGMWLYNNLFGGGMSSASAADPGAGGDYGGADAGGDATTSGGDYGADGGGADAGGADAGGGDWGGGGGGDWGGGGGGDWGGGGGGGDW